MMRNFIFIGLKTFIFLVFFESTLLAQNKVDIGIFESPVQDTLVVKARPNYNLASPWYITNIVFTIKWSDTSNVTQLINITSTVNSFFGLQVQQSTVHNGYHYQVYAVVGQKFVTWTPGNEYPILEVRVNYPGGDCTEFEISNDAYTRDTLNGGYWFEVVGANRTGIRYAPSVSLISIGGTVAGNETICKSSSTSVMTLTGYSGSIETWQKKHNGFSWTNISGTAGLSQYSATPDSSGNYQYRARVQRGSCGVAYSIPAVITVEGYSSWRGTLDTLWNNPGNWNVCGVPNLSKDAEIPVVASGKYPTVVSAGQCKSLTIRTGASLRLLSTGSLNVGGTAYQPDHPVNSSEWDVLHLRF
jgi:hypothetical protein